MMMSDEEQVIEAFRRQLPKQGRLKRVAVNIMRRARLVNGTLLIKAIVPLPRDEFGAFWEELGAVHGAVATAKPDVDFVTIEDAEGTPGQRITVKMKDLLLYKQGELGPAEYVARWKIERGKEGENAGERGE
jgi:hypothetical protein